MHAGPPNWDDTSRDDTSGARSPSRERDVPAHEHALRVLEFPEVLNRVAARATSELGRARIRALRPHTDPRNVARSLRTVRAVVELLEGSPEWTPPGAPDAREALARLRVEGGVTTGDELRTLLELLSGGRHLLERVRAEEEGSPELSGLIDGCVIDRGLEAELERTVGPDGEVLDTASTELRSVRGRLVGARNRIVRQLDSYLGTLDTRFVVSDASVTIREGRYVIPIRREGRGTVGGVVHGESATGQTLFVEPPVAIELMNEVRSLERDEAREVQRVLRSWSERLRPRVAELDGAQEALVAFDAALGRARAARDWSAEVPELSEGEDERLRIVGGRHPLLLEKLGDGVVPFDLDLASDERILVVSGPNTGGKSVLLKSVGLIAALAQSGIIPPVRNGSVLPVYGAFFADIGDEQSISDDLSTYSARLGNVRTFLEAAGRGSLILVDEMGSGTDPAEGAALARAVLEILLERGARAIVTSHLGDLKRMATDSEGIVNASLQFDAEGMRPTYRFVKGRPGRSYGLATARRLGIPESALARAEAHLADEEIRMEALLASLETKEEEASDLVRTLRNERNRLDTLRTELEGREARVGEAERTAKRRAEEEARALLLEARSEVDAAIRSVTEAADAGVPDDAARGARRQIEQAAERLRAPEDVAPLETPGAPAEASAVEPGSSVRYRPSGGKGTVVDVGNGRAQIDVGGVRLNVPLSDLEPLQESPVEPTATSKTGGWSHGDYAARVELDLRGKRADEAEFELLRFLDEGILADLSELKIIHGKGTGALRGVVESVLARDGRIQSHRPGVHGEGGTGVTVVTVR